MSIRTVTTIWQDAAGDEAKSSFAVSAGATTVQIEALIAAMQALSDLKCIAYQISQAVAPGPTTVPAEVLGLNHPYADDKMELRVTFSTANRRLHPTLSIPGPKPKAADNSLLFGNDMSLVRGSTEVENLGVSAVSFIVSEGGTPITSLKGGHLEERRGRRAAG